MSRSTAATRRATYRRLARRALLGAAVVGLLAGLVWLRTLPLARVVVAGAHHASAADIADLTEVVPDTREADGEATVALFSLSPALMADRASRHPWVASARVTRWPTGTLRVTVEERVPVALALADGEPSHFFDAEGYAMPVASLRPAVVDVPVFTGDVPAPPPGERTDRRALRSLLAALAAADAATAALVSEIHVGPRGALTLYTTPAGEVGTLPVRLGRTDHADQLARLRAFWDQAVLPRPTARLRQVDLRYRGQVVTLEGEPPAPDSSSSVSA